MSIDEIHALEKRIIDLARDIRTAQVCMTRVSYDHWGTLDVNLDALMRASRFLSEDIHQQMEGLDQ